MIPPLLAALQDAGVTLTSRPLDLPIGGVALAFIGLVIGYLSGVGLAWGLDPGLRGRGLGHRNWTECRR